MKIRATTAPNCLTNSITNFNWKRLKEKKKCYRLGFNTIIVSSGFYGNIMNVKKFHFGISKSNKKRTNGSNGMNIQKRCVFFSGRKKDTHQINNLYISMRHKKDVNRNETTDTNSYTHTRTTWSLNTLLHIVQVYVLANKENTMTTTMMMMMRRRRWWKTKIQQRTTK